MMPYLYNQSFLYIWGNRKKIISNDNNDNESNDDKIIFTVGSYSMLNTFGIYSTTTDELLYTLAANEPITEDLIYEEDITLKAIGVSLAEIGLTGLYVGKNRTLASSDVVIAIQAKGETIDIYGTINLTSNLGFMGSSVTMNLYGTINISSPNGLVLSGNSTADRISVVMNGDGTINTPAGFEMQYITSATVSPKVYTNLLNITILDENIISVNSTNLTNSEGKITVNDNVILESTTLHVELKNLMNSLSAISIEGKQTVNNDKTITPIKPGSTVEIQFTNP